VLELFDKAARPLQSLVAGQPKHSQVRPHQRNAHWGRADVLAQLGRAAAALPEIDRALELTGGADRPLLLGTRGVTLAKAKRFPEALAAVEPLVEPPTAAGRVLYRAACVHALASAAERGVKAEAHARRAVELLVRAGRGAYFGTPPRSGHSPRTRTSPLCGRGRTSRTYSQRCVGGCHAARPDSRSGAPPPPIGHRQPDRAWPTLRRRRHAGGGAARRA
jgi:hypothetical protein